MSNDWRFNILIIKYLNIIEADTDSKNYDTEDDEVDDYEGDKKNSFHDAVGNQNSYDDDVVNSEGEDADERTNEPNE